MSVVAPVVTIGVTVWAVRRGFRDDARLQRRAVALTIANDGRRELVAVMDAYCAWLEKANDFVCRAPQDRKLTVGLQPFGVSTELLDSVFGDFDEQLRSLRNLPGMAIEMAVAFPALSSHQQKLEEADRIAVGAWRNFRGTFVNLKEGHTQVEVLKMAGRSAHEQFVQSAKTIKAVRDDFQRSTLRDLLTGAQSFTVSMTFQS